MTSTRPPFPLVWDNTMRSAFVTCPTQFKNQYLNHWKPRSVSVHLHAGSSWAHGLEVTRRAFYCHGVDAETAVSMGVAALLEKYGDFPCPDDSAKSAVRLSEAFVYYFHRYPLATDPAQPYIGPNGPMIEFSFVLPLGDDLLHPETGEPILYSGRADMVALYAGSCTIFDDKTTASLGATWANQWDMRAQFTGYSWAAQQYGIPATQILIRGIAILKTKLETAQAISHRAEYRTERWLAQVKRDIRRAAVAWESGVWDMAESDACGSYGGCMFRQACSAQDPQPWLETGFTQRKWDPVLREEIDLSPSAPAPF